MAKEETAKKPKKKRRKGGFFRMLGMWIVCITLVLGLQLSFILFLIGIIPSGMAYLTDTSPNKHKFHAVLACNLSGVVPYIAELLANGNDVADMQEMLRDLTVLAVMYGSAGLGWLLFLASPHIANAFVTILNSRKTAGIYSMQDELIREWGPEVKHAEGFKDSFSDKKNPF